MPTLQERTNTAVALLEADTTIVHSVANGAVGATVTTEGGQVRTVANAIATLMATVARGAWLTATAYAQKDLVTSSSNVYICVVGHTSGVFATDLAAGKWALFAGPADEGSLTSGFGRQRRRGTTTQHLTFTGLVGEVTVDTTKKTLVVHDGATAGGIQVARQFTYNVRDYGAVGDGSTDDTVAVQAAVTAAAAVSGAAYLPRGTYKLTASINLPSNVTVYGDGYGSLLQSAVTGTFAFFQSTGRGAFTAQSNIRVFALRFKRTNLMGGSEGPFDGSLQFANCNAVVVEDCIFQGSATGVHFYGCYDFEARNCKGYYQSDTTVRINPHSPIVSGLGSRIINCYSENAGYASDGTTAIAEPSGAVGSAFLCCQSDVLFRDITCVNSRHNSFEIGAGEAGTPYNVQVDGFHGIGTIAARALTMLLNDLTQSTFRRITFSLSNNAGGVVYIPAGTFNTIDGVSYYNSYTGWAVGVTPQAVNLQNCANNIVRNVKSYVGTIIVGGGANCTIENCEVRMARQSGFGLYSSGMKVDGCTAIDCGNDTDGSIDPKQRAGFVIQSGGIVQNCMAIDTRAGGSRTQRYGYYVVTSATFTIWNNNSASNNVTADAVADSGPVLANGKTITAPDLLYVKAGVVADSTFKITPPDGAIAYDSTNHKIGVRDGGVWKWTAALS